LASTSRVRRQIRGFVLVWIAITLAMGACTFAAIYLAYSSLQSGSNGLRNVAVPAATTSVAMSVTSTSVPTRQSVQPTLTPIPPTQQAAAQSAATQQVAPAATETKPPPPTATPTILPVDDKRFQVGIQVQVTPDGSDNTWMGVVSDPNKLGLHWVKIQVRWKDFAPNSATLDYTALPWVQLDSAVNAAASHHLHVMLSVVTAPDWAREPGIDVSRNGPPANPQDYANFAVALVQRYAGKIHAMEVWNEMNLDREWTSMQGLSPANYVHLLAATSQAVKAVDPGIIIISGALSPTGVDDHVGAWDDYTYLDALIQNGLLNYADCVGAHHNGYNVSPNYTFDQIPNDPAATFRGPFDNPNHSWSFRSTLQTYYNKIQLGGGTQKLCVTEFGWPSTEGLNGYPTGFEFANDNTLDEQKQFTVDALNNMVSWDNVWLAFIWNLNYGPLAGWDPNNDNVPYSFIGPGTSFRPVTDAVRDWNKAYEQQQGQ
jgi:polysaccharide biosynthesis protein PslG